MGESWVNVEAGQVLVETNNGQGDCLFMALSQQLGGELTSLELRQMAVQYLSDHRVEMNDELLSLGWDMMELGEIEMPLEGDVLVDAVLQTLANSQTWAGAECIAALSLSLSREIRVYQEGGPTIVFAEGNNPGLRVLLRYPHGGLNGRSTHYESVLNWRIPPVAAVNQSSSQCDAATQTAATDQGTKEPPIPNRRSDSAMVLRPRRNGENPKDLMRDENFSDAEEFTSSPTSSEEVKVRFRKCRLCHRNVEKYAILNCGAFPVCGSCMRTWYVNIEGAPCPHCGRGVAGWTKVF